MAEPSWKKDLFIRKAIGDTGTIPYTGGTWTNSPDIIPNGTQVVGDSKSAFGGANYNTDQGKSTVKGQPNYFYARAKNLSNQTARGELSLYYCPQNLFLFPSLWSKNQMKTSSGKDSVSIVAEKEGDVAVTGEPFTYTPDSDIHSCLVARLNTQQNPNPLPQDGDFGTFDDLGKFIVNHPNYGWRNVVLVDAATPTFTNQFQIDTTSLAKDTTAQFLIGISFKGLTVGSKLAFSAGTPVPSGPDQGKVIQLAETAVTQRDGSLGTSYLTIPAGYKTTVQYSYWASPPVQKGWTVQFYAILITNPDMELHAHAMPISKMGVAGLHEQHPLLALNSGGISKGIRMGDVSTVGR